MTDQSAQALGILRHSAYRGHLIKSLPVKGVCQGVNLPRFVRSGCCGREFVGHSFLCELGLASTPVPGSDFHVPGLRLADALEADWGSSAWYRLALPTLPILYALSVFDLDVHFETEPGCYCCSLHTPHVPTYLSLLPSSTPFTIVGFHCSDLVSTGFTRFSHSVSPRLLQ